MMEARDDPSAFLVPDDVVGARGASRPLRVALRRAVVECVRAVRIWRIAARPPDTGASRRQWWCCGSYFRSKRRDCDSAERVTVLLAAGMLDACAVRLPLTGGRLASESFPSSKGVSSPAVWSS